MAKSKRKVSTKQRDPFAVQTAKILKRKGVLAKTTKLHGGKFVSRAVLKKVAEFKHVAHSTHGGKAAYTALKVPKEFAKRAREEGYQVVGGNRVIVPAEHDFIARVRREARKGPTGGISGIRPVKGGHLSEVTLPFTPQNSAQLMDWLATGNLDDLKLEHEMFSFTFFGSTSKRAFLDAKQMRQYLEHYKQDEVMKALKIFRLHPEDQEKFISYERVSVKRPREGRQDARGDYRRATYAEKMARMERNSPGKYNRIKREQAEKHQRRIEKLKSEGRYEDYASAARKRALESWRRRNPPK